MLAQFSVLLLIGYLPLPLLLKLAGFVAVLLWFNGLRRGGKVLLIGSPLLASLVVLVYFPLSQRAVGMFVLAYMIGLVIVGIVDYARLSVSVWRFMTETRDRLQGMTLDEQRSRPVGEAGGVPQKRR